MSTSKQAHYTNMKMLEDVSKRQKTETKIKMSKLFVNSVHTPCSKKQTNKNPTIIY